MIELWLVRHGETDGNARRVFMGHGPVPLSDRGRAQIRAAAERLDGVGFHRFLASDLLRAWQSAEIIAERIDLLPEKAVFLREIDVGDAQGLPYEEAAARWPGVLDPAGRTPFPRGESFAGVAERAGRGLLELAASAAGATRALAVAHGGVVRGAVAHLTKTPLEDWPHVGNASISIVRLAEGGAAELVAYGDASHLDEAPKTFVG